jgi:putative endonuclease
MSGAWVYILRCADGSYYTGLTRADLPETRLSEHMMRLSPNSFTAKRLPVTLAYAEYLDLVVDAIAAERKIKGWSRAKKEALIEGRWDEVQRLAKRRGGKDVPRG